MTLKTDRKVILYILIRSRVQVKPSAPIESALMVADNQPGARMQMVWKQPKKRTRPLPPPPRVFQFRTGEEHADERPATSVMGEQPRSELPEGTELREELENSQQSDKFLEEGNSLAEEGRFGEALGKWEAAIFLTPRKAVLHEQKAQLLLEIGKPWSAVQAATCATELQPTWAEAWVTLARAQLNFGEPSLAVDSAQAALRLEPDNREANTELERAQFLAIRQRQATRESEAGGLGSDSHGSLPSSRRARVYDTRDISFGGEHHQVPDQEPEAETKEDDKLDKYDDDSYDWVDDLRRPAPEITTDNLMSDFSDTI